MNPSTGELVRDIETVPESKRSGFVAVPKSHYAAAREALADKASVIITPAQNRLYRLMGRKRRELNRKKNKMQRASRKANR